jgi:hypothetical protein
MRTETFINKKEAYNNLETQYGAEIPYLKQTRSWKKGTRYQYSPDNYLLTEDQLLKLQSAGNAIGKFLDRKYPRQVLEFRIDFVESAENGLFYITEVQTDDRGLPAVAIVRNARGQEAPFPGVVKAFVQETVNKTGKHYPKVLITFPKKEEFYYAGFHDFATLCWGTMELTEVIVTPRDQLTTLPENRFVIKTRLSGQKLIYSPDLIWDFSDQPLRTSGAIQPKVSKQLLLDITQGESQISKEYVPETRYPDIEVVQNKKAWVLKPIEGRWSKGVVFGFRTSQDEWEKEAQKESTIAQQFIKPLEKLYYVREGQNNFRLKRMLARVEGYYIRNSQENLWVLADVLATCTKDLPVHGKRDCIMIPGKVPSIV